ncbi:protein PHOX1 [Spinacia oleracea]|uniref:Protein PHOX1 n=1 Tax=Spinacia oleracea TaxID=3562 RepID=A0A9R0K8B4_SPIOL|nr:protein PHOX1-like [Spinacia oleracea]
MGKPIGKKKPESDPKQGSSTKASKGSDRSSKAFDEDTAIFINMSQEFKDEGSKLFQKQDYEGAMLKFEKALKLLPSNHIDVANLRTNMASCYMQMGLGEYPRAISECNLALEVAPKYSKAFLRRAKCFEGLHRLDLAWRDVSVVLNMEPNNQTALELSDSLKKTMDERGIELDEKEIALAIEHTLSPSGTPTRKIAKAKTLTKEKSSKKKRRSMRVEDAKDDLVEAKKVEDEPKPEQVVEKKVQPKSTGKQVKEKKVYARSKREQVEEDVPKSEDKEVVQEKVVVKEAKMVASSVKLVFGDDIRYAQLPINCSVLLMRDVVRDRFPSLEGFLVKYKDQEGDLVTITTTDELRKAEGSGDQHGSLRLYISEVSPDQEPTYEGGDDWDVSEVKKKVYDDIKNEESKNGDSKEKDSTTIDSWIIQFAQLFKNYAGFDSDAYLDQHEIGMKLYSEAIEDTISSEDAQQLFDIASDKFQEMAALALFNMGNVHMSKARKQVPVSEDTSGESMVLQIKSAYEWAKKEYTKACSKYEEALKIKPDFYEGHLSLGQQQFELAKLCWHYAQRDKVDVDSGITQEILLLYNKAEDSMEAGMQIWEEMEERRLNGLSKEEKYKAKLQKLGLDGLLRDLSADEATEQASILRSQIYILWGTLLYERSIVEFKLGLPSWEECLEVAVEKFELAGASHTDITVMIKNHCSNQAAPAGLGFKIDEIVQAWNEMYDAKRWQLGVPSNRLEPLFRRRVPRLHQVLEHL